MEKWTLVGSVECNLTWRHQTRLVRVAHAAPQRCHERVVNVYQAHLPLDLELSEKCPIDHHDLHNDFLTRFLRRCWAEGSYPRRRRLIAVHHKPSALRAATYEPKTSERDDARGTAKRDIRACNSGGLEAWGGRGSHGTYVFRHDTETISSMLSKRR